MFGNMFNGGYPFMGPQMAQNGQFMPGGMSTPQQPLTPPTSGPAFIPVPSVKEFDSITIQPGRQALIMAQNDPYIAFKSADAMGMVTTSLYRLEPVTADQINGPAPEFVTRQEFQQTIQHILESITKPAPNNGRATKKEASE